MHEFRLRLPKIKLCSGIDTQRTGGRFRKTGTKRTFPAALLILFRSRWRPWVFPWARPHGKLHPESRVPRKPSSISDPSSPDSHRTARGTGTLQASPDNHSMTHRGLGTRKIAAGEMSK